MITPKFIPLLTCFSMIIARCSVRDRCNQNDRQHFVGHVIATVHVCGDGRANVQGRGLTASSYGLYETLFSTSCIYIHDFKSLWHPCESIVWAEVNNFKYTICKWIQFLTYIFIYDFITESNTPLGIILRLLFSIVCVFIDVILMIPNYLLSSILIMSWLLLISHDLVFN